MDISKAWWFDINRITTVPPVINYLFYSTNKAKNVTIEDSHIAQNNSILLDGNRNILGHKVIQLWCVNGFLNSFLVWSSISKKTKCNSRKTLNFPNLLLHIKSVTTNVKNKPYALYTIYENWLWWSRSAVPY